MKKIICAVITTLIVILITPFLYQPSFAAEEEKEVSSLDFDSGNTAAAPKIVVADYEAVGDMTPGSLFTLSVTIRNKSADYSAENIKLTFSEATGTFVAGRTDSAYIDTLPRNKDYVWEIPVKISSVAKGGDYIVNIQGEYESITGIAGSFSTNITVTMPEVETTASVKEPSPKAGVVSYSIKGDTAPGKSPVFSITVKNKSEKTAVTDYKLTFTEGSGTILPSGLDSVDIGRLEAGEIYKWDLPVKISKSATGGNFAVTVTSDFSGPDGEKYSSADNLTVSVPVKNESTTDEKQPDVSQPRLMISSYTLDGGYLSPDSKKNLIIVFKNNSEKKQISNIKLSLSEESGEIRTQDMATKYVSAIGKGDFYTWDVELTAVNKAATGEHNVTVAMEYEDENGSPYSSSEVIRLQVRQKSKLSYNGLVLPATVTQGDTVTLSVTLMNTGKGAITNCQVSADIEGLETAGSILIGDIKPGDTKTGNLNLRVSSDYLGDTKGTVAITYEDEFGEEYKETQNMATFIKEYVEIISENEETEKEKANKNWWIFLLIGLIVAGAAATGITAAVYSSKIRRIEEETL
ncbi:MAG: hypothetical protein K6B52_07305 [Clostridiales bacterium]|nr:hypothetical protein [Clostridiales bacterium]